MSMQTTHPAIFAAAKIMLHANGVPQAAAVQLTPEDLAQDDGGTLDCARADAFLAALSPADLEAFCVGDEEDHGRFMEMGDYGVETSRLLSRIFDWTGTI